MSQRTKVEIGRLLDSIHVYSIDLDARHIYLQENSNGERSMAQTFIKNLHILEKQSKEPILIHMHTGGGEWVDFMSIYDSVKLSPCPITILAYAEATSMSGVLLQAADKRVLMPNCEFMIHHGNLALDSNHTAAKSAVSCNERYAKIMMDVFSNKMKKGKFFKDKKYTEVKINNFLDRKIKENCDWYLNAKEAVFYGLADGVFGEKNFIDYDIIKAIKKTN